MSRPPRVPILSDSASTLCYVADRLPAPMAPSLQELGLWPFDGIQTEDTMLSILGRWARAKRALH